MRNKTLMSAALATAAGLVFTTAPVTQAQAEENDVKTLHMSEGEGGSSCAGKTNSCKGMNACKGKGGCKTGDNGCKGKNSCKGKGGCKTSAQ